MAYSHSGGWANRGQRTAACPTCRKERRAKWKNSFDLDGKRVLLEECGWCRFRKQPKPPPKPPPHIPGVTKKVLGGGYTAVWIAKDDPYLPQHHKEKCRFGFFMPEHRYVVVKHLGRPLRKYETVHHKNGKRDDNRIENLELWKGPHRAGQRIDDVVRDRLNDVSVDDAMRLLRQTRVAEWLPLPNPDPQPEYNI